MNNYFGNGEIFYYHVALPDNKTKKIDGTFWITSNYGYLKCAGTYADFKEFCRIYNINPYFVG